MGVFDIVNILAVTMSRIESFPLECSPDKTWGKWCADETKFFTAKGNCLNYGVCLVNYIMFIFTNPLKVILFYCHDIFS